MAGVNGGGFRRPATAAERAEVARELAEFKREWLRGFACGALVAVVAAVVVVQILGTVRGWR